MARTPETADTGQWGTPRNQPLARKVIQRHQFWQSKAANMRLRWDDCARYIQPRKGNIVTRYSPGMPLTQNIYDTTAEQALLTGAAGVLASLMPLGERWMLLQPKNRRAPQEVHDWFDDATERTMGMIGNSNWYLSMHEGLLDDLCFGTDCLFIDENEPDDDTDFNLVSVAVGTFVYAENAQGLVDRVSREWKWTARQAAEEWGIENMGPLVRRAMNSGNEEDQEREFTFIHQSFPRGRGEWDPYPAAPGRRRFGNVYVCKDEQHVILEDGHYEAAFIATRLLRSNIEIYGRGPGVMAMPEIKAVNKMEQDLLVAVEKLTNPPWLMPDGESSRPDNRPNGVTYWDSTDPANKPEQLQLRNNVDLGEKKTEQKRAKIRELFFNDMFKMLTSLQEERREKTAYEVSQMVAERLILFSPIFASIVREKLNPALHRIFAIGLRRGKYAPAPPTLAQAGGYEIEYTSKIALAIKAIQNQALAAAVQILQSLAPLDPSVVHLLKAREAGRDVLRNVGVRTAWIRSDSEIDAIAQAQAQAQQQLAAAQAAMASSQAVKNLGPQAQAAAAKSLPTAT